MKEVVAACVAEQRRRHAQAGRRAVSHSAPSKSGPRPVPSPAVCPLPSFDTEAEFTVIGNVLDGRASFGALQAQLEPADFYEPRHQAIWKAMGSLERKGQPIDAVMVHAELRDMGLARQAGGSPYLARARDESPFVLKIKHLVDRIADKSRARQFSRVIKDAAAQAPAEDETGRQELIDRLRAISEPREPKPTVSSLGFWATKFDGLRLAPPKREWLFSIDGAPCFPRGHVGSLIADGGVGKSYLLYQFAIAAALGGLWLETFQFSKSGRVALFMGEDDELEAQNRLWKACNERDLCTQDRDRVCEHVKVFPLHGIDVALVETDRTGNCSRTVFAAELFDSLRREADKEKFEWSAIVFDPLARFGSADTETSNSSATRFAQVTEEFTKLPGNPSVLVSHHASQNSVRAGTPEGRGVTGIRNAFRWGLTMVKVQADDLSGVILRGNKSNLSPAWRDIALVRNPWRGADPAEQDRSGTLRLARGTEPDKLFEAADMLGKRRGPEPVKGSEYECRVLDAYNANSGIASKSALAKAAGGKRKEVMAAIARLVERSELPERFRGGSQEPVGDT